MKTKRILAAVLAVIMAASITAFAAPTVEKISVNGINVMVNDQLYKGINLLYNDRTYVPLRDIAENIGCTVDWEEATSTATITSRGNVQFPQDVVTSYGAYDEAYAALKVEYDMLISYQNTLAATVPEEADKANAEAARLTAEFEEKAAQLKADYANKEATKPVAVEQALSVELNAIVVVVNGVTITEPNILYQDRTYVPFRAIFEALGCKVDWNDATQTASITGFFNEGIIADEVFTSFDQEYAELVVKYEALIAEQIELGQKAYDEALGYSGAASGGQAGTFNEYAESYRAPYTKRAEELRQELAEHEVRLKEKYGITE